MDQYGNDQFVCDCNPTLDEVTGIKYVGPTCEIPVNPGDYCGDQSVYPNGFCVNGGSCRNVDDADFDIKPCDCQSGNRGKHCEFGDHIICDLDCGPNGECRNGLRPVPSMGSAADIISGHIDTSINPEVAMYCECHAEFTGTFCDYEYTTCGDFEHYCFHGSQCDFINGAYTCLCELDGSPGKFHG